MKISKTTIENMFRVISGFGGALYVWVHRRYVFFMRSNKVLNKFLQKNRFLYPGLLALMVRIYLLQIEFDFEGNN